MMFESQCSIFLVTREPSDCPKIPLKLCNKLYRKGEFIRKVYCRDKLDFMRNYVIIKVNHLIDSSVCSYVIINEDWHFLSCLWESHLIIGGVLTILICLTLPTMGLLEKSQILGRGGTMYPLLVMHVPLVLS